MFITSLNGTKSLVFDRRKFLGMAAGLIASGVLPKNVLALAVWIPPAKRRATYRSKWQAAMA